MKHHIAVLDIGKTNKKWVVFDETGRHIEAEGQVVLPETTDEDGDPCEDIALLRQWITDTTRQLAADRRWNIRAIHCATYGASFVHVDAEGEPVAPLYNYLKPFPDHLRRQFFDAYGGEERMAVETASPVLGMLNSGLQLYWLKYARPDVFARTQWSLHLPQYAAALIAGVLGAPLTPVSEMTSIGCHTMLWDFVKNDYHQWVNEEGIADKLPPIFPVGQALPPLPTRNGPCAVGAGLHDSSAALIPYLKQTTEPFLLLSTGTWCIALNPFNDEPLTAAELAHDCLCYLTYAGKPVKAARYFGGHEHEQAVRQIAAAHGAAPDFYRNITAEGGNTALETAYQAFMEQLMEKQAASIQLAMGKSAVRRIFVDGGFAHNPLYLHLLAQKFPDMDIVAADAAQATAQGAALVMLDVI